MMKYIKYLGVAALMAFCCSCADDNVPQEETGTVVKKFCVKTDDQFQSRAGQKIPGDGSDIKELSYIILDPAKTKILYGTGLDDSPVPVKVGNHWELELELPSGTDLTAVFWANKDGNVEWGLNKEVNFPVRTSIDCRVSNGEFINALVKHPKGWSDIDDDAVYKIVEFNSDDVIDEICLSRKLIQVLIGTASFSVKQKINATTFGYEYSTNEDGSVDLNNLVLPDRMTLPGGVFSGGVWAPKVSSWKFASAYLGYSFPFQKEGDDEYCLLGGGYCVNKTDGLRICWRWRDENNTEEWESWVMDSYRVSSYSREPNTRYLVILYPHNETAPVQGGAITSRSADGFNDIIIPVAI